MTMTLQSIAPTQDRIASLRPVSILRFVLPVALFVLATGFEFWEHGSEGQPFPGDGLGWMEVIIFGMVGPFTVFVTLSYVLRLLQELERAGLHLATVNQNLEETVLRRTMALQTMNVELESANTRLREIDQMKSDFVALVSHELRAPLATLNGGLEVARQDETALPAKSRRILQLIAYETQRLTQFVQTLLDVSQLEAGRLQMNCGPVAVRPILVRSAEIVLGAELDRIQTRAPDHLPPILADETYLEEVVRNLLRNALKYSPQGTPIGLSAAVESNQISISVTDHGPGIPAQEQAQVFERFYRVAGGSERKVSGWGLGLYFARMLTIAQGGTISLTSPVHDDPDAPGSTFAVTFPIAEGDPDDGQTPAD